MVLQAICECARRRRSLPLPADRRMYLRRACLKISGTPRAPWSCRLTDEIQARTGEKTIRKIPWLLSLEVSRVARTFCGGTISVADRALMDFTAQDRDGETPN
jgi:hypothetical protein